MITTALLDRFLASIRGQALREGTRYAREARVLPFAGTAESASTIVRGQTGEFAVVLWVEAGALAHRCECPSWREPCKHEVAAALVLKQGLQGAQRSTRDAGGRAAPATEADPGEARARALEERVAAARREKLAVRVASEPPWLEVESPSGFVYRVHLRGTEPTGPHGCDCPDFEANRLHTCKHVERVRRWLGAPRVVLPEPHRSAARRARVYLHFGEVIEPRLLGRPRGTDATRVLRAFDGEGVGLAPLPRDDRALRRRLAGLGAWVEPEAFAWVDGRVARVPALPSTPLPELVRLAPGRAPYPYQWEGAAFLARRGRALLADEMGLGKTVQALLAAAALAKARPAARSVTIVCPASLRGGWQQEIARWLGEDVVLLEGPGDERARVVASRPRWLVTHYEQVLRDHAHHRAQPPDLLIVDEAQRAKGLTARTARVLKAIDARYVFALTGTPLENRLEEAYAIAQLVDQRLLPPLWQLDRDHFVREREAKGPGRVVAYRDLGTLRSRLAPAFLRRRKEDVALELPDRVRSVAKVPLHAAVRDTYEDMMLQVARIARKRPMLPADVERIQRLLVIARRCCDGPHMLGEDVDPRDVPKLAELEQVLRDACVGERRKAVVFSEWTDMTDAVEALCERLRLPTFHLKGDVPVARRPAMIRDFTARDGAAVFVSTDAGGVGLNLQAADLVVNLDLPWNPARLEQRIARVHRIGSKRTVQELLFVTSESLEERILELHETKRRVLDNVWAEGGDDVVEAPGGSGAFRTMIEALLGTATPAADGPDEVDERVVVARGAAGPTRPTGGEQAAVGSPPRDRRASTRDRRASTRDGRASTVAPPDVSAEARGAASAIEVSVDPSALAAAIAAIAPTLPPEHRRSLATVFQTLADALEA